MPMLAENIMKSSKVSRVVIAVSTVAIVGLVTYNWAVSSQVSYVQAAQQYENMSQNLEKKSKIMSNSIRIKNVKLEKLHTEIKSSPVCFFTGDQADDFFAQLEKISTAANCNLTSLVFTQETTISIDKKNPASNTAIEKNASIKIDGTFGAIVNFTAALKDYPQTVCMSNLMLKPGKSETQKLSCSMNLKVYLTEDKELLSDE